MWQEGESFAGDNSETCIGVAKGPLHCCLLESKRRTGIETEIKTVLLHKLRRVRILPLIWLVAACCTHVATAPSESELYTFLMYSSRETQTPEAESLHYPTGAGTVFQRSLTRDCPFEN